MLVYRLVGNTGGVKLGDGFRSTAPSGCMFWNQSGKYLCRQKSGQFLRNPSSSSFFHHLQSPLHSFWEDVNGEAEGGKDFHNTKVAAGVDFVGDNRQ